MVVGVELNSWDALIKDLCHSFQLELGITVDYHMNNLLSTHSI